MGHFPQFGSYLWKSDRIFMKILSEIYLWTRKNQMNFGSHPPLDPDLRIFKRILQHCETGHFPQFGSYLWKKTERIFVKIIHVSLTMKSPLHFGIHPNRTPPDQDRIRLWRSSAMCECSCLKLAVKLCAVWYKNVRTFRLSTGLAVVVNSLQLLCLEFAMGETCCTERS